MILKCKMCGGDIELSPDKTIGTCECCASTMTFPKIDDERRANMFNRGNHFRRAGEFDKALAVYEHIVQEDENDAEAHWCCALCRFGIEYVEDPNTFEFLPTCHRASFDSFLEDVDYLAAIEHSEGVTRRQYQKDAAKIAEVQRGILATSQNEEPFDVFICYKESENDGTRTRDSLLAQDIYYQLTEQGRRVFFSRITLEDKAGTEYEPYIFAALNSAKVMIVVTTSAEHVNAVWVKNEWSRFLSLMRKDRSKLLLPCYRDMDPYDLPEALSVLQSYDMSKIGFIQDLIRGINKVLDANKLKESVKGTVLQQQAQNNVAPLLERAFIFLEDGEWESANNYCEKVLDLEPKNGRAYLGKLMVELKTKTLDELKKQPETFDNCNNYQKAYRFGNQELREELSKVTTIINDRNERARKDDIYKRGILAMQKQTEPSYKEAAELFATIADYKDAKELKQQCLIKAQEVCKEQIYQRGLSAMKKQTEASYNGAAELFATIADYKDAKEQEQQCIRLAKTAHKEEIYQRGLSKMRLHIEAEQKNAETLFRSISGFRDAEELAEQCVKQAKECKKDEIYQSAISKMENGSILFGYESAISLFKSISGWKDADEQALICQRKIKEIEEEKKAEQERIKAKEEADRLDCERKAEEARLTEENVAKKRKKNIVFISSILVACIALVIVLITVVIPNKKYNTAVGLYNAGKYDEAIVAFQALNGYKDSAEQIAKCENEKYNVAVDLYYAGEFDEAIIAFQALNGYKDSVAQIEACKAAIKERDYPVALALFNTGKYKEALSMLFALQEYKDSDRLRKECWNHVAVRHTIECNSHTVGLKVDGTVVAKGYNKHGSCYISDWKDIVAIAAGDAHTVGLKADGTVVAKGYNDNGQCDVSGWEEIVSIAAGIRHTVGLKSDGTVIATGGERDVSDWKDIVAIAEGSGHTVGLKANGTVVAVGSNEYGQCDVSDWKDIVAIAAGGGYTVGLKADGTAVAVGINGDGSGQCNVTNWKDIVAIAAGGAHTVALKADGTVVAVGWNKYDQCNVTSWKDVVTIAAGYNYTVGLKADGTVVAVGRNDYGQCNVSDWRNIKLPGK